MINLSIPISKISNLCGNNKFVIQSECFFNAYKKNNVSEYKKILKRLKREDKNEQNKNVIKSLKVNELVTEAISSSDNSVRTKVLKTVENKINEEYKSLPKEERNVLIKNVKKQVDTLIKTSIGTNKEEISLDSFEDSHGIKITSRNDELFYGYIDSENVKLKMGGKIDGVNEKEGILVEHKIRMNRLFDTIPLYEKMQIFIYMNFTGMEKAILIQTYKDEQNSMELEWNDNFYEIIVKKIRESLELYYQTVTNPKKLENLIKKYTVKKIDKCKAKSVPITSFFNVK
jgi:hypothetical protein